jgi:hypothetical protein
VANLPLSLPEKEDLAELERVVERGNVTFVEVGRALCEIRDRRLYRGEYKTFDDYLLDKWSFTRMHASRLIGAYQTVTNLVTAGVEPPANEGQARALVGLDPDDAAEALEEARETASEEGRKVTARDIAAVARKAGIDPASLVPDPRKKALAKIAVHLAAIRRELGQLDSGEQEDYELWLGQVPTHHLELED